MLTWQARHEDALAAEQRVEAERKRAVEAEAVAAARLQVRSAGVLLPRSTSVPFFSNSFPLDEALAPHQHGGCQPLNSLKYVV